MALFSRMAAVREPVKEISDPTSRLTRLGYDPVAFDGKAPPDSLKALFPDVLFQPMGSESFSDALARVDLMIAAVDATKTREVEALCAHLRDNCRRGRVIVFLSHANVEVTRRLVREGAGDVLVAPISEPALAASLERIMATLDRPAIQPPGAAGHVVAMLKAGGGVGATVVAAQVAALVASTGRASRVCLVDLDIQFGMAAMYLDVVGSITMGEVLAAGGSPSEVAFTAELAPHSSGAKVLGAPKEFLPLESISSSLIDGLLEALRRDFDLILLDLPSAWTSWVGRVVREADQLVMVTNLSVPHAHVTQRQLSVLRGQGVDPESVTLVCNRCGGDAPASLSIRAVEAAIGRSFDVTIPEDRKLMSEAVNQGAAISNLRRGSKLEKALRQLIGLISAARIAAAQDAGG